MTISLLAIAATVVSALGVVNASGQTILSSGHMDIGVLYESGAWDLHVHKESPPPDEEFAPSDAVFQLAAKSQLAGGVPDTPDATGFFGPAGSPLWVLPRTEDPELPFLGLGAEELSFEDWVGPITLTLAGVRGPGNFFVWDVGAFGELLPRMSSRDGISAADSMTVEAGGHAHYFWAFAAPGDYEVDLSAMGNHLSDGLVQSDPSVYRFRVVPEPRTGFLLATGLACLRGIRRRSQARRAPSDGGRAARA